MAKTYSKRDIFDGKLFDEAINEANQMIKVLEVMDTKIIQLSSTYKNTLNNATTSNKKGIEDIIKVSNELNVVTEQANKLEKDKIAIYEKFDKEVQKRQAIEEKAHAKREQQYNKEIQQTEKLAQKEAERAEKLSGSYAKVQLKLNQLSNVYRDLAIKKELGLTLTDKEEKRYTSLQGRIQMYDKALKQTDASMGKHQRNVGNYASAYNGLNMSVSQLAREMPAFANSVQTGFMAISNNLPMFFDEITKIKDANKQLSASGEPTKSLFKQLAGSIFSVSTLLSIGVTLLTVYGAKVIEMLSGSQKTEEQLKKEAKAREELNRKKREGAEFVGKESAQLVGYLEALKATNAGSKERAEMIAKINDQYGLHLKNLKDEADFQNQVNDTIRMYIQYQREAFKIKRNTELIEKNLTKQEIIISKLVKSYGLYRYEIDNAIKTGNIDALTDKIRGNGKATEELLRAQRESAKQALVDAPLRTEANKQLAEGKTVLEQMIEELKSANVRLEYYGINIANAEKGTGNWSKSTKKQTQSQKELNTELGFTDDYLTRYIELNQEIQNTLGKRRIDIINQQAQDEFQLQKDIAENLSYYDITKLNELIELKMNNEIQFEEELTRFKIEEIRKRYALETEEELKALEERYQKLLSQEGINLEENASKKAEIERQYKIDKQIIAENDKKRQSDLDLEIQNIEIQHQDKIGEIRKTANQEKVNDQKELDEILMKNSEEANKKTEESEKKADDNEKKRLKDMQRFRMDIINQIIDEMKRLSKEREMQNDKEISDNKALQDKLQAQANAGNITAQESIASSIEAQKKATLAKQQEQARQQRLEEIKILYNLIESKIDKGDSAPKAIGKSLAEMGLIRGASKLLDNIKGFYKGTKGLLKDEHTPIHGGKDGHLIFADGNEMIVNPTQTNKLASVGLEKTDDVVNSAIMYKMNVGLLGFNAKNPQATQSQTDMYLKKLVDVMESKGEFYLDPIVVNGIAKGVVSTEIKGNVTKYSEYRPKA